MTTKKSDLPLGLTPENCREIKIKSIKKEKKGFIIEIKPDIEKELGAKYHYMFVNGLYHILCNNETLKTPGDNLVTTISEPLAKRTVEHMNIYGEDYSSAYSIVTFLYSNIDYFENQTKEEMDSAILNDLDEIDWTLKCPYDGQSNYTKWIKTFGALSEREEEFTEWLKGLKKFQTGAIIIMGATFESVNTAYLLSNQLKKENLPKFAEYYDKCWRYAQRKNQYDLISFWPISEMLDIFDNYLFCQSLEM